MAEKKLLQLTISRVDGPLFDGEVVSVTVPGSEGEMTLMAGHESLMTALKAGTITIKEAAGTTKEFTIEFGTLEVSTNHASVLV